jgi:hypothetical protein
MDESKQLLNEKKLSDHLLFMNHFKLFYSVELTDGNNQFHYSKHQNALNALINKEDLLTLIMKPTKQGILVASFVNEKKSYITFEYFNVFFEIDIKKKKNEYQ